ncbi:MAG TPA: hypothetical protein PLO89_02040, partial [Spirochaetota bacterium]|nr:hypothetical protein [Spirochaetota bacterium]
FAQVKLLQEVQATTGPDGIVTAVVQYRSFNTGGPQGPGGPASYGYMMVDMPGCALAFGKLMAPKPAATGNGAPAAPAGPKLGGMPSFPSGGGKKNERRPRRYLVDSYLLILTEVKTDEKTYFDETCKI